MSSLISTTRGIVLFSSAIVGAGILALPVVASHSGFLPLAAILIFMAAIAALSGLYIAESVLAQEEGVHLPTLAVRYLGVWGLIAMMLGIGVYTYGALLGYLAAGGQIFFALSGGAIPAWVGTMIFFIVATAVLHQGIDVISPVNSVIMYAMLVLLGIIIGLATPKIQVPLLIRSGWSSIFDVIGVVLFAYLGHCVIPSIAPHLKNRKQIGRVVAFGIALPCVLYLAWTFAVLGVVPADSENGASLSTAAAEGQPATIPLGFIIGGSVIVLGNVFAGCSTITSFIAFGFSLKDAYGDLTRLKKRSIPGIVLTGLVVLPPLIPALLSPTGFVRALDIAGTFGGGLFVGILPVLILLKARRSGTNRVSETKGGNWLPCLVLSIYVVVMLLTAARLAGVLK